MRIVDVDSLMKIEDVVERHNEAKKAFDLRKEDLALWVKPEFKRRGVVQRALAKEIDMKASSMNRSINPRNNKFSVPLAHLSEFAFLGLGMSGHELLFGTKVPTRLPRPLSTIARHLAACSEETKFQAVQYITGEVWNSEHEKEWRETSYSPSNSKEYTVSDLIADRLTEIVEDRYITAPMIFGLNVPLPSTYRETLRFAINKRDHSGRDEMGTGEQTDSEDLIESEEKTRSPSISTVMFTAMCLYTTVDYFTSVDYTKYGKVRLYDRDKNGNDIIVEDPDVLYVISRYLRLSKEGRDLAHTRLLRLIWES